MNFENNANAVSAQDANDRLRFAMPVHAWREPPALTLDEDGVIVDCSGHGEEFFGYARAELADRHVSVVLPGLLGQDLFKHGEPDAYLNFLCRIGHLFEVMPRGGAAFLSGFSLVCLTDAGNTLVRLIAQSIPGVAFDPL